MHGYGVTCQRHLQSVLVHDPLCRRICALLLRAFAAAAAAAVTALAAAAATTTATAAGAIAAGAIAAAAGQQVNRRKGRGQQGLFDKGEAYVQRRARAPGGGIAMATRCPGRDVIDRQQHVHGVCPCRELHRDGGLHRNSKSNGGVAVFMMDPRRGLVWDPQHILGLG